MHHVKRLVPNSVASLVVLFAFKLFVVRTITNSSLKIWWRFKATFCKPFAFKTFTFRFVRELAPIWVDTCAGPSSTRSIDALSFSRTYKADLRRLTVGVRPPCSVHVQKVAQPISPIGRVRPINASDQPASPVACVIIIVSCSFGCLPRVRPATSDCFFDRFLVVADNHLSMPKCVFTQFTLFNRFHVFDVWFVNRIVDAFGQENRHQNVNK